MRPTHPGRAALREAVVEASTRMHAVLSVRTVQNAALDHAACRRLQQTLAGCNRAQCVDRAPCRSRTAAPAKRASTQQMLGMRRGCHLRICSRVPRSVEEAAQRHAQIAANGGAPPGLLHAISLLMCKIDAVRGMLTACSVPSSAQDPGAATKADEQALTVLMRALQQHWLAAQAETSPDVCLLVDR